jgi:Ribose/xylose/arabinose/galactoside ABC-type transport systems, permease components
MENKRFKNNVILSMLKNNIGIITVLLIIGIVLSFISPVFLTVDNIVSVLRQVSNNIYLALGMTLVIILGGIDLSVGAIVAMCGTLTVGFIVTNGIPIPVAIFLGLLIGTVCGLFNGLVISHFKVPAFIVTLAMMNMAKGIAYIYSGGRSTRITDKGFIAIGSGKLFNFIPLPVVYMIILIIVFTVLLNKTKFGTHIYAVGGNRESAYLSGIPIKKTEIIVYTLAGFLAAFAGLVLCSRMFSGQPSVGEGYELDAIAACVLGGVSMSGGIGSISGTIFGAIIIGIVSNGLNLMGVSSFWQLLVKGIIILIAVLIDTQKGKTGILKNKNN